MRRVALVTLVRCRELRADRAGWRRPADTRVPKAGDAIKQMAKEIDLNKATDAPPTSLPVYEQVKSLVMVTP